jgi:hypothetical protein
MAKSHGTDALTRVELVVVIAIVFLLVVFLLLLQRGNHAPKRLTCLNNLKQIGTAYRIWANDNGGQFPAFAPPTNGGWSELLARSNANNCVWTNYSIIANALGRSPLVLV